MKKNEHHYFFERLRELRHFFSPPPVLPEGYDGSAFLTFMKDETYRFSPRYAKRYVVIHNQSQLIKLAKESSALLTPLHYGSFFLAGGAIVHQLRLPYTAIVTGRNLQRLPMEEQLFWKSVHKRSSVLYKQPLFYTGQTHPTALLNYLKKSGNLLGAVLDVREDGQSYKEYSFNFLNQRVYLQTGPARLAYLAKVPILPMTIQYHVHERRHHLYFGEPIYPCKDHIETTQRLLSEIESHINNDYRQFFYDILSVMAKPVEITI